MEITNAMKSYYNNRVNEHIKLVNYFAGKLNKEFPMHDCDKFDDEAYESNVQYLWEIKSIPNVEFNNVTNDNLIEVCADICALCKQYKVDPFNYLEEHFETNDSFDDEKKKMIYKTINIMWSGE